MKRNDEIIWRRQIFVNLKKKQQSSDAFLFEEIFASRRQLPKQCLDLFSEQKENESFQY